MEMKLKEKKWDTEIEKQMFEKWENEKIYKFNKNSGKEIYAIDHPPVYPSGNWHIGAVAAYTLLDMCARTQRMKGKEVLFPFSLDRNGINIELTVEKKYKKRLHDFERDEFNKLCKEEIDVYSKNIIELGKKIGMSAEFKDPDYYYETDSPEYRKITQRTFIEIFKKGLVYEDLRPNNYCPGCKTTIAEAEIEYEELPTEMNYMKWKIKETGEEIEIGTTRPELLCACQAVLYNPEDERYKHLKGKHALIPLYGREIEVIPNPAAKQEFGSGMVMICSYGDTTDVQLFRELKLKPVHAINEENKMTEEAGFLEGLRVKKAREKIIEKLIEEKIIFKQEKTTHRTPTCERSGDSLEFISMKEWYVKQLPYLQKLKETADKMKFYPEKKQANTNQLDRLSDNRLANKQTQILSHRNTIMVLQKMR